MALTFTKIQETVIGNLKCWIGTVTFDGSYTTGGLAYTPASFGMSTNPVFMSFDDGTGYAFQNDRTNKKIIAYTTAATEAANAANLAAIVTNVMVLGI